MSTSGAVRGVSVLALLVMIAAPARAQPLPQEPEILKGQPLAQKTRRPRPRRPSSKRPPRRRSSPRGRQPRRGRRSSQQRCSGQVQVPIDVSLGPTFNFITGPVQQDQLAHFGGRLNLQAVLDQRFLRRNAGCIPKQYRGYARRMREARIKPIFLNLIPRELLISPRIWDTGIYGIGWNLYSVGVAPLSGEIGRLGIALGLPVKYMFIHSETLDSPTHFLRPGLEANLSVELKFTRSFLMSFGWASQVYVPQPVGGAPWEVFPLEQAIWHIGQAYFKLHVRVPYTTSL